MTMNNGPTPVRYALAISVLLGYAIASSLVVSREGHAFREGRRDREIALAPPATPRPAEPPAKPKVEIEEKPPEPEKVEATPPPPMPTPTPAPTKEKPAEVAAPEPPPANPLPPQFQDNLDLKFTKPEDETKLGEALHGLIVHETPPVPDNEEWAKWYDQIDEIASPLKEKVLRKQVHYKFTILDSDAVNAFSHPGGYIYITRGMLSFLGRDDEDSLRFVVAGEIAHVDHEHSLRRFQAKEIQGSPPKGTLAKFYFLVIPGGYKEDHVYDADQWAMTQMLAQRCDHFEILTFLRKLEKFAMSHGFSNEPGKPRPTDYSPLDNHIRSPVTPKVRRKKLEALMLPAPQPRK